MIAPATDAEICGTIEKIADALPESDLINRMRLNSLLAQLALLQHLNGELMAELARRPRVVLVASNELVPQTSADRCTRCNEPLGLKAFRVPTVDGERHTVCPEPASLVPLRLVPENGT